MEGFADAAFQKLQSDDKDENGNHQPGEIFVSAVTVGMLLIGGLGCQLEAQKADDAGGSVGQVVHRVRHNGNRSGQPSCGQLDDEQKDIGKNPGDAEQFSVFCADGWVCCHAAVFYESSDKKICHAVMTSCGVWDASIHYITNRDKKSMPIGDYRSSDKKI